MKYICYTTTIVCLPTFLTFFAPNIVGAELHPGESIERSLRTGATDTYSLNLAVGDVVSLLFSLPSHPSDQRFE